MNKTKNASCMFYLGNYLYKNIILGDFNSEKVLNLSSFDTREVVNMRSMLQGMARLVNLNVSSFDTRMVTNMAFYVLSFTA